MGDTVDLYFNGSIISCSSDHDCPLNTACYINATFLKPGYKSQCGCMIEWGEVGSLCDQPSFFLSVRKGFTSFSLIVCVGYIVYFLYILYQLHLSNRLKSLDVKVTVILECFFTTFMIFLYQVGNLISYQYPHLAHVEYDKLFGYKKVRDPYVLKLIPMMLNGPFLMSAVLNIGILWLEVAINTKQLKRKVSPQLSKRYKAFAITLVVLMLSIGIPLGIISPTLNGFTFIPVVVIVIIIYTYGARQMTGVLSDSSGGSSEVPQSRISSNTKTPKEYDAAIRRIRTSATLVVTLCIIILLTSGITSTLIVGTRKSFYPDGRMFPAILLGDVLHLLFLLLISCLLAYIQPNVKKNKGTKTSSVDPEPKDDPHARNGKIITPITGAHNSEIKSPEATS